MLRQQGPAPLGTTKPDPTGTSGITAKGPEQSGGFLGWISSWFGENDPEQKETEDATKAAIRSANRTP